MADVVGPISGKSTCTRLEKLFRQEGERALLPRIGGLQQVDRSPQQQDYCY